VTEQYEQESQKTKALDALVKALRSGDIDKKKAGEKLTSELHMLQEKYKDQGAEYSKLFMVCRNAQPGCAQTPAPMRRRGHPLPCTTRTNVYVGP